MKLFCASWEGAEVSGQGKTVQNNLESTSLSLPLSVSESPACHLQVLQADLGLICMSEPCEGSSPVPHRASPVCSPRACQPEGLHTQLLLPLALAPSSVLSPGAGCSPRSATRGPAARERRGTLRQSFPGPLRFGSWHLPLTSRP